MKRRIALRDETGANLVEFALVLPVLVLFLFGIIDFGVAYDRSLSLRSGVQQGARAAVVANFGPSPAVGCWLNGGITPVSPQGRVICTTKRKIGLPPRNIRVHISFVDADGTGTPAYEVGDFIRLCVDYPMQSASGVLDQFFNGRQRASAEMRIEQVSTPPVVFPAVTAEDGIPAC